MVLFNYSTKEITAKIVYYGPGLCGKTTNLQFIHSKLDTKSRGKLLSLATETDRTLFFDFLPLDLGKVSGFHVRFQLYTVPGQVHYNATRRMVLKGVDAVVFVADSQAAMIEHNKESFENLRENLVENGYKPEAVPLVIQLNKRDLPNIASPTAILEAMGAASHDSFEAVATQGDGVFETLKAIIKLSVAKLKTEFNEESLEAPSLEGFETKPKVKVAEDPKPLFNPDTPMVEQPPDAPVEAAADPGGEILFEDDGADDGAAEIEVSPAGAAGEAAAPAGSDADDGGAIDLADEIPLEDEAVPDDTVAEVALDDEISLDGGMDILEDDMDMAMDEPPPAPAPVDAAPPPPAPVDTGGAPTVEPSAAQDSSGALEELAAEVKALREENRQVRDDFKRMTRGLGKLAEALGELAAGGEDK